MMRRLSRRLVSRSFHFAKLRWTGGEGGSFGVSGSRQSYLLTADYWLLTSVFLQFLPPQQPPRSLQSGSRLATHI